MQALWDHSGKRIVVYVFVDVADCRWEHRVSENFFSPKDVSWQQRVLWQPVFLEQQEAFDYIRFIGRNYVIMKASLPESQIMGDISGLKLKPGNLILANCLGLFEGWDVENFVENPYYNVAQASV